MEFNHVPVMLREVIESLDIKPGGTYIDCTVGGGGHSFHIASHLCKNDGGRLIGIDQDTCALEAAGKRLAKFGDTVTLVHSNFSDIKRVTDDLGIEKVDGILADLGVSSYQLDTPDRGFSYMHDAPLDMRMNREGGITAYDIVNGYSENELSHIISEYGEERFAKRIASSIVKKRELKPVCTTGELALICRESIPAKAAAVGGNPAKRTFQAIRVAVNRELDVIEPALKAAATLLVPGGRLCVITFHSLEDRIVKQCFASLSAGCICPPDFPVCVCGHKQTVKLVSKKPYVPSQTELAENSRSHSAKLRVVEKV